MIAWHVATLFAVSASSASLIHCSRFISTELAFRDATAMKRSKRNNDK